jgi:hypothetical protein
MSFVGLWIGLNRSLACNQNMFDSPWYVYNAMLYNPSRRDKKDKKIDFLKYGLKLIVAVQNI